MEVAENLSNNIIKDVNVGMEKKQNGFLQSTFGKVINTGLNFGLRLLLPDMIENQVIEIKDTLLNAGLKEGINKAISSATDFGKSALGIVTGKFENVGQAQAAFQKGGIIDGVSDAVDFVLDKTQKKGLLPNTVTNTIRSGKNSLLNTISNNIENEFNRQLESAERLQRYCQNWKECFNNKDFDGMTREYYKINVEIKTLLPMEKTINDARTIQNLQNLIKNNGKNFNLSDEQLKLAEMLNK